MNKGVFAIGLAVTVPLIGLLLVNIDRDPTSISSPLINKPAPDVRLMELSGGASVQLSSLRGRPAVVNFWATWCIPCIQEHASLTAGARANPDVAFLGVVYEDTAENARGFLASPGARTRPTPTTTGRAPSPSASTGCRRPSSSMRRARSSRSTWVLSTGTP